MSKYVAINASKAENVNSGRTGNMHGKPEAAPIAEGDGRPMCRVQPPYPVQSTRREPARSGAPTTTMTTSAGRVNVGEGPTGRRVVHFSLASKGNAPLLQTCEKPWVPSCLRKQDTENSQPSSTFEDRQIEETRNKFMSILNKVSPENMHMLTGQIMALPINTEQCLEKSIGMLFKKAIDEPNFTPQYAYICTEMHKMDNKRSGGAKLKTSFKKLLTMCCQDRLNRMSAHDEALAKTLQDIKGCDDQDKKEQMQATYDQDEMMYRERSVGNCRFMCELYKVEMLTRHILEMSLKHLLKTPKEETLECACNILRHTGNAISHKASFNKISEYMSPEYKCKIPTRLRFMMQDIVELKENDWVPRNSRPKPPTSNTTAQSYAKNPRVPLAPVSTLKKKQPQTEIRKVNLGQSYQLANDTKITPVSVSDGAKSYASQLSTCTGRVTRITNKSQPSDDEIQKKCQLIVDTISPENMVPMAQSMLALPVKTEACLKTIVDIVFEKAMNEPETTPQYAHICSIMKNVGVRPEEQNNTNTTFGKLLIAMCQNAFEAMSTRRALVAKDRQHIESCKDKETRRQLQLKFDENELVYRRRCVANCRFICELLKVNVLFPPILEMCVDKLVETLKETSMECLYIIVKHSGNEIDHSEIFEKLSEYLTAGKQKLSLRVRSMIQDTLQLKDAVVSLRNTTDRPPLSDRVV